MNQEEAVEAAVAGTMGAAAGMSSVAAWTLGGMMCAPSHELLAWTTERTTLERTMGTRTSLDLALSNGCTTAQAHPHVHNAPHRTASSLPPSLNYSLHRTYYSVLLTACYLLVTTYS